MTLPHPSNRHASVSALCLSCDLQGKLFDRELWLRRFLDAQPGSPGQCVD